MLDKARILYIEDNFDSRRLVRRVLESQGFEVVEAQYRRPGTRAPQRPDHRPGTYGYQHA